MVPSYTRYAQILTCLLVSLGKENNSTYLRYDCDVPTKLCFTIYLSQPLATIHQQETVQQCGLLYRELSYL